MAGDDRARGGRVGQRTLHRGELSRARRRPDLRRQVQPRFAAGGWQVDSDRGVAGGCLFVRRAAQHARRPGEDRPHRKRPAGRPAVRALHRVLQRHPRAGELRRRARARGVAVRHHAAGSVRGRGRHIRRFHGAADGARILPSLQREAYPTSRDVALRLPRRAIHTALVVVRGRHRLLRRSRQPALRVVDHRAVPRQCHAEHAAGRRGAGAME